MENGKFEETFHEQEALYNPMLGQDVLVDKGMVDILNWLWSRGIQTEHSCQGSNLQSARSLGYISFKEENILKVIKDMRSFEEAVLEYWSHKGTKISLNHDGKYKVVVMYRRPGMLSLKDWFKVIKKFFSQDKDRVLTVE